MIEQTYTEAWIKWVHLNFDGILKGYWSVVEDLDKKHNLNLDTNQKLHLLEILIQVRHPYYLLQDLRKSDLKIDTNDLPKEIKDLIEEITSEIK